MHKLKYLSLIAALGLAFCGCSGDETDTNSVKADELVTVPITMTVGVKTSMQLAEEPSRADSDGAPVAPRRPINWLGQQAINDLRMYVFACDSKDGDYIYYGGGDCPDGGYLVPEFSDPALVSDLESYVFEFKPTLQIGKYYKFLAVGRDDIHGQDIPELKVATVPWGTKTMSDADFKVGVTRLHDATIQNILGNGHYPFITTEIFAGLMTYRNNDGKVVEDYVHIEDRYVGFQKEIVLHRAVAALWIYITDIPTRLVDNSGGVFDGVAFEPRDMRVHMETSSPYLSLYNTFTDYTTDLEECRIVGFLDFHNRYGTRPVQWQKIDGEKFWHRDAFDFDGFPVKENCALITNYLIPYDRQDHDIGHLSTLHILMYENEVGHEFNCRIRCHIESVTDPITGETRPYDNADSDGCHYPILPNCIYAIGTPEEPYSLSSLMKAASRGEDPEIVMTCTPIE